METTARIRPSRAWVGIGTAAALSAAAVFYYVSGTPARVASALLNAVAAQKWDEAYKFMGTPERDQLKMDPSQFNTFCKAIAAQGWPTTDKPELEEMSPYVSATATTDTSWSLKGTHRFSVTLRRPDGQSDLHTTIEYRHDPSGEWRPDVLPLILAISRGTPGSHPVQGLLDGMVAIHLNELETYPLHQRTTQAKLKALIAQKRGFYLETPLQYFR